jgi:predicted 3-demethylubiquinone-9 3-methyltransferase (glyoxalase superfamily)
MMPLNQYAWSEKYGWIEDKYGISWQLSLEDMEKAGKKISPVLMFTESQHGKAEEAINRYISVFDDSEISLLARYEEGDDDPAIGTIKHARFRLGENTFMTMDSSYSRGVGG